MVRRSMFLLSLGAILGLFSAQAENWAQWRGPYLNGTTTEKNLPERWSPTENIAWVADLAGKSGGTPIIWEDQVFVTACSEETKALRAICLDRKTGGVLWQREAGTSFSEKRGNLASSPSPVVDGEKVYFTFGTGRMMAFDLGGRMLWDRNVAEKYGEFHIQFGYSSTPLLYGGKFYLPVLHGWMGRSDRGKPIPDSYLLCFRPNTGEDIWRQIRETDAQGESYDGYTSAMVLERKEGDQIVVNGGNYVTGHDPETGEELWRSDSYNKKQDKWYRTVASVLCVDGMVIAVEPKGHSLFALPGDKRGQLTQEDRIWTVTDSTPDVCVPTIWKGKLFVLDGARRKITCRNPKTGELLGSLFLEGRAAFYASPIAADGRLYLINLHGECIVLSADKKLEELHRVSMEEPAYGSSISISQGNLYIRTDSKLYCVGTAK